MSVSTTLYAFDKNATYWRRSVRTLRLICPSGETVNKLSNRYRHFLLILGIGFAITAVISGKLLPVVHAGPEGDQKIVADLDTQYQAAVKRNDAVTMARILSDDFVLVTGSGKTYSKKDMLDDAQRGDVYERNDEESQTVRVWGDTAVVTAKLWEKYTSDGKSFDHKFWFSDTYIRTPSGWKYVFGQSSLPLPNSSM